MAHEFVMACALTKIRGEPRDTYADRGEFVLWQNELDRHQERHDGVDLRGIEVLEEIRKAGWSLQGFICHFTLEHGTRDFWKTYYELSKESARFLTWNLFVMTMLPFGTAADMGRVIDESLELMESFGTLCDMRRLVYLEPGAFHERMEAHGGILAENTLCRVAFMLNECDGVEHFLPLMLENLGLGQARDALPELKKAWAFLPETFSGVLECDEEQCGYGEEVKQMKDIVLSSRARWLDA